ncbi:MAG: hypothetical protein ACJAR2_003292 [Ilumatobacter sp.]
MGVGLKGIESNLVRLASITARAEVETDIWIQMGWAQRPLSEHANQWRNDEQRRTATQLGAEAKRV